MTRKHPKVRKPRTLIRNLAVLGELLCTCPALTHTDRNVCAFSDFNELLAELRASLRENDGHTKGRRP